MLKRLIVDLLSRRGAAAAPAHVLDRARAALAAGDAGAAERLLGPLHALHPQDGELLRLLGVARAQAGQLDTARDLLASAAALAPASAQAFGDLGNVLRLCGDAAGAEAAYRRALAIDPSQRLPRINLAGLLADTGRAAEALEAAGPALAPPAAPAALKLAVSLLDALGRPAEAVATCERVLAADPHHAEAHASLGFLLLKRELAPERALPHLERAAAAMPDDHETLANRGIALQDLGRVDEALRAYEAAIRVHPDDPVARFHRALALLLAGDFTAWPDYELRLVTEDRPVRPFPGRRWRGEDMAGQTLLVHAEQGLGDEIMFASCLPDLLPACGHVVVDCHPKLAPLFARSFPAASVHGGTQLDDLSWLAGVPPIDAWVPIGSLPLHFRAGIARFPRHPGYLRADPARVAHWRSRLCALGPGLKVGISWRGGAARSRRALRSLTPADLGVVLDVPGVHFVDLQYDGGGDEFAALAAGRGGRVHRWPEALADYDETAALVSALDQLVSVCTAIIHLGGALGRPVWVLAPFSPEWRYGIRGEGMPWYPSVRVLRQPERGAWGAVLAEAAARLRALAA